MSRYDRVFFEEFENFSVKIIAQFFIDLRQIHEQVAKGAVRSKIIERLESEKIKMPTNIGVLIHEQNEERLGGQ